MALTPVVSANPSPAPPAPPIPKESGILRGMIAGNYFYFLSAALMLLGSYMLMHSPVIQGGVFVRTLKTLVVLQVYELLVIVTALAIVRRLRVLDDAFTLLLVELVLLLDPTFFSNSFFTMPERASAWVNVACLALVPLKLAVLCRGLRLKLAPRAWAAFLFAAVFTFLAEGPLIRERPLPGFSHLAFYYLLAWGPVLYCLIAPPARSTARFRGAGEGFAAESRQHTLGRVVLWAPLVILFAHFAESSNVYDLPFYMYNCAPLVLGCGVLVIRNVRREELARHLFAIDIVSAAALFISSGLPNAINAPEKFVDYSGRVPKAVPDFVAAHVPLIVCGLAVVALYAWFYRVTRHRPALARIVALVVIGGVVGILRIDGVGHALHAAGSGLVKFLAEIPGKVFGQLGNLIDWLVDHPSIFKSAAWLALLAIAARTRRQFIWFFFGLYSIWLAAGWLADDRTKWIPEMLQAAFLLALALSHIYHGRRERVGQRFIAIVVVGIGFARFCDSPAGWSAAIVAAELVALAVAAYAFRDLVYGLIGGLLAAGFAIALYRFAGFGFHLSLAVLAVALVLFAVGVFVTFNKERLIGWLDRHAPPPQPEPTPVVSPEFALAHTVEAPTPPADSPAIAELEPPPPLPTGDEPLAGAPAEDQPAAGESERVSPWDMADMPQYLCALFMNQPEAGIFLVESLEPVDRQAVESAVAWETGERPVVCFTRQARADGRLTLLLTDRRLVHMPADSDALRSVFYSQIAAIDRLIGMVRLTGHLGQKYALTDLGVSQVVMLERGLQLVVHKSWEDFVLRLAVSPED